MAPEAGSFSDVDHCSIGDFPVRFVPAMSGPMEQLKRAVMMNIRILENFLIFLTSGNHWVDQQGTVQQQENKTCQPFHFRCQSGLLFFS